MIDMTPQRAPLWVVFDEKGGLPNGPHLVIGWDRDSTAVIAGKTGQAWPLSYYHASGAEFFHDFQAACFERTRREDPDAT